MKKKFKLKKGEKIHTNYPLCYCIAKSSNSSAVFVIPPTKKKKTEISRITDSGYIFCSLDDNLENIKVGDWCEVAYVTTFESGFYKLIKIL